MLTSIGLIFLLSSTISFSSGRCSNVEGSDSSEECNQYLDRIIRETIEEHQAELEPYKPEPANFSFEHKITFVTIKGEVSLHDIAITGLTTIHREGDCKRSTTNGISKLVANLGMGLLEFDSKAAIKFIGAKISSAQIHGEIGYAMIHLEASRDKEAGSLARIDKLEMYDIKGTKLKVTGFKLTLTNMVATKLAEGAAKIFKTKIRKEIENKLKERLDEKIKDSVFPID